MKTIRATLSPTEYAVFQEVHKWVDKYVGCHIPETKVLKFLIMNKYRNLRIPEMVEAERRISSMALERAAQSDLEYSAKTLLDFFAQCLAKATGEKESAMATEANISGDCGCE